MPSYLSEAIKAFGYVGSFVVFLTGLSTYYRTERWKRADYLNAEKWKRAEFVANAMKGFFENARIQRALSLIDWGYREMVLLEDRAGIEARVVVTRQMQAMGLRPHTLLNGDASDAEMASDPSSDSSHSKLGFTPAQAAIRDCYDAFLDGLERLASNARTGVIDVETLRPYIGYWVDDIAEPTSDVPDAAWSAALLTYISFYRFDGVLWLFKSLGKDISPGSPVYRSFLKTMEDQGLASQLAHSVKVQYP